MIIIYDLRTAAKWRILDGHKGSISCISFDKNGKFIASYSGDDSTVKIWKVGSTGFFGSMLGMSSKYYKSYNVPRIRGNYVGTEQDGSTIGWVSNNKWINLKRPKA